MNRPALLCLAAAAILATACERHPASELPAEFTGGEGHGTAEKSEVATPKTPEGVPANPAGSAPAKEEGGGKVGQGEHAAAKPTEESVPVSATPAAKPAEAPQFFPQK